MTFDEADSPQGKSRGKAQAAAGTAALGAPGGGAREAGAQPEFDPAAVALAQEALQQARTSLMLAFRFLDLALWRMPIAPAALPCALACDGATLWFDPLNTLRTFRESPAELARDLLHCLLHCLLRHPFDANHDNTRAWWLACDMATEEMAREMAGALFPSQRDRACAAAMEEVRGFEGAVTPQRLCDALEAHLGRAELQASDRADALAQLERLFLRDSHERWPQAADGARPSGPQPSPPSEQRQPDDGHAPDAGSQAEPGKSAPQPQPTANATAEPRTPNAPSQKQPADDRPGEGGAPAAPSAPDADPAERAQAERTWEEVSKRVQEDLETYSRGMAGSATCLLANVAVQNRAPVDYADFLRRFATRREDLRVNDEEFDYVFYTYGMETYGDMPLIEPLEYQETDRVREFVIAIDTSASCAGDLVRRFIDRTFQILQQSEHWGSRVNIHVVQCDERVREDVKITSMAELKELGRRFQVKGLGGTDFRPVFAYVDELVERGEFDDLRGIIYFTDGYGTFPKAPPAYDAAFVFLEDEGQARDVPPWAMKVVLRNEQLSIL